MIAQLALALVLLTGSGLMLRTVVHLWGVSPGFVPQNLLVMTAGLSPKAMKNPALIRNAWQQMLERVRNTPGVQAAALDSIVPLSGSSDQAVYWTTGTAQPPKNAPKAWLFTPTPDYLRTMKIPLLRGRFSQNRIASGARL